MSKILKDYWSFEDNSTLEPYKLGQIINFKEEYNNLKKTNDDFDYEYIGPEKFIWIVTIKNGVVVRLIYRQNFPIPNFEFWTNDYDLIYQYLIKKSKLVDKDYLKNKMCVITRDYFVTLIILQKGLEE